MLLFRNFIVLKMILQQINSNLNIDAPEIHDYLKTKTYLVFKEHNMMTKYL